MQHAISAVTVGARRRRALPQTVMPGAAQVRLAWGACSLWTALVFSVAITTVRCSHVCCGVLMVRRCGWWDLQKPTSKQGWQVCRSMGECGDRCSRRGCHAIDVGRREHCLSWVSSCASRAKASSGGWACIFQDEVPMDWEQALLQGMWLLHISAKGLACPGTLAGR